MKLFIALISFIFITSAFAVINEPGQGTYVNNLGVVESYDGLWTTVKNDTGSTIAAGSVVKYGSAGTLGYNVVLGDTVGEAPACVVEVGIPDGKSGKCRIYGRMNVLFEINAGETAVLGEAVYSSGITSGYAAAEASGTVTALYRPIGQALTTCSATGTCEIFVNIK